MRTGSQLDSHESSFREKLIEHMFVAELLKHSWRQARQTDTTLIEISRAEVDRGGYDLIAEHGEVLRHIQLKGSKVRARTRTRDVHLALEEKASACVVWVFLDDVNWKLGPYYYLGGKPDERISLPSEKVATQTRGDAEGNKKERPNFRTVKSATSQSWITSINSGTSYLAPRENWGFQLTTHPKSRTDPVCHLDWRDIGA